MLGLRRCLAGWKFLAILLLVGAAAAQAETPAIAFAEANAHFDSGNFDQAAEAYQALHVAGTHAPELYYNRALAEEQRGDTGAVVLNLHRALALDPTFAQAREALERTAAAARLELPQPNWLNRAGAFVGPRPLWLAGGALAWGGAFLVLTGVFVAKHRRAVLVAGVVCMVGGGAFLGAASVSDPLLADRGLAVVTSAAPAPGKSHPLDNADRITDLAPGTTVELLSTRGRWAYCALADGRRVWVPVDTVTTVLPESHG